jgi:hypothetical protein
MQWEHYRIALTKDALLRGNHSYESRAIDLAALAPLTHSKIDIPPLEICE